ncbi:hypothetical protein IHE77_13700 [Serratia ureilytica]|uniref:hypothetical protein n=1 Tax=Serratia ureilytica TaxID=300181 RepID=UPI001F4D1A84|nr:hypothetical protein [Serratia ureilytica]UNE41944.1 hypothetical protein IHE77_13700 [Serratia ureilytica]
MFGFSKRERIDLLKEKINGIREQAKHIYQMKGESESSAFYELAMIAKDKGITASQAAKTPEGIRVLSEVVLNRQYAFFLNETAIQLAAELNNLKNPKYFDITNRDQWFDDIVTPVGIDIVVDQIEDICGSLIREVEEHINPPSMAND